jgi:hypothetical protein
MPYGTGSYGALEYGGDFDNLAVPPAGGAGLGGGWWWNGVAARTIADAGFLLIVAPHFETGAD